ncbi:MULTISPECIES: hypothetical protein [unclassified Halomonas]|uniref:hypothetical protein n=1 Tax=unclassified Halomonas TaxID=2609666 RepID=UPI002883FE41|nr:MULTISPECIES: hypothetical protein [unclassified Halomonas]MDT0501927.1 hypothetical protein [Halomonas sp. PAR7]MDT0510984.1 hypothetical protein [Halomonas sp. LES1]MDT0592499.1 hypothetical protein [Halomonas sp. PAR8]
MIYFATFIIAVCVIHLLHAFFLKPALSEIIKLEAANKIKLAESTQNISEENSEYLKKLTDILRFIINENDEITFVNYISALAKMERDENRERGENAAPPKNICPEVKEIRNSTIRLFHESMANNSLMLVLYLSPVCLISMTASKINSIIKRGSSENHVIELYDKHKNHHA